MIAIASRKSAETIVPIMLPIAWNAANLARERSRRHRDRGRREHDDRGVAEREEEADADAAACPSVHQLARDVVDRRNVVGVDRVAKAEPVGEQRGAEQQRIRVERAERPRPRGEVGETSASEQSRGAAAQQLDHEQGRRGGDASLRPKPCSVTLLFFPRERRWCQR